MRSPETIWMQKHINSTIVQSKMLQQNLEKIDFES